MGRTAAEPTRSFDLDFTPMRKLRGFHLLSREALARAAGVHPITIWRLETNRLRNPSMVQVVAIARAMSVPMHELFTVTEPRRS